MLGNVDVSVAWKIPDFGHTKRLRGFGLVEPISRNYRANWIPSLLFSFYEGMCVCVCVFALWCAFFVPWCCSHHVVSWSLTLFACLFLLVSTRFRFESVYVWSHELYIGGWGQSKLEIVLGSFVRACVRAKLRVRVRPCFFRGWAFFARSVLRARPRPRALPYVFPLIVANRYKPFLSCFPWALVASRCVPYACCAQYSQFMLVRINSHQISVRLF